MFVRRVVDLCITETTTSIISILSLNSVVITRFGGHICKKQCLKMTKREMYEQSLHFIRKLEVKNIF